MADLVFFGGTILTMDPNAPRAEALAIGGGRVTAVGPEEVVRKHIAPDTDVIDLAGGCIVPGLHDSHVHLTQYGFELEQVRLDDAATLDEGLERIAARAREREPGTWILGAGFALERWGTETLDAALLDRVAPEHPVLLRSQDHHSAWANGRALELAGIGADTPEPEHGTIVRHGDGSPTGFFLERAYELVRSAVPAPGRDAIRAALRRAGDDLAARGITTVHHMAFEPPEYWRELAALASDSAFPVRVWACVPQEDVEHAAAIGLATGQGGESFQVGGAKFFADGALGSRTAWMLDPYPTGGVGVVVDGPETLAARLPLAIDAGLTPVIHAIGDAANRTALDALEQTRPAWSARNLRPRIEHAQHVHPDDVPRFGALGVVASVQPIHFTFDGPSIRRLLADRVERAYPWRSLEAGGAVLAFGSDAPVAFPDVFGTLRTAVRRRDVHGEIIHLGEALAPDRALAAYTSGPARAIGWEHRSGHLRAGADADICILGHDPLVTLDGLEVQATLKAGRWTYRRSGTGRLAT